MYDEKLEKMTEDEIIETIKKLLHKYPEVSISMVKKELDKVTFGQEIKKVSMKRLKKLIWTTSFLSDAELNVTYNLAWNGPTIKFSYGPDIRQSFKNMPVQNRLAYIKKIVERVYQLREDNAFLGLSTILLESVYNSFTDQERLAAEMQHDPIPDYSSIIKEIKETSNKY